MECYQGRQCAKLLLPRCGKGAPFNSVNKYGDNGATLPDTWFVLPVVTHPFSVFNAEAGVDVEDSQSAIIVSRIAHSFDGMGQFFLIYFIVSFLSAQEEVCSLEFQHDIGYVVS